MDDDAPCALARKKASQRGAWLWVDVNAPALSAVEKMCRSNVGALLVMRKNVLDVDKDGVVSDHELTSGSWDDAVAGVICERDYLNKVVMHHDAKKLKNHTGPADVTVGDIMTGKKNVLVACIDTPVLEAMRIMTEGRCRHMPVVNIDRTMAGMLSLGDMTRMAGGRLSSVFTTQTTHTYSLDLRRLP